MADKDTKQVETPEVTELSEVQEAIQDGFVMSIAEVSVELGFKPLYTRSLCRDRKLSGRKIRNRWYVHPDSLTAYKATVVQAKAARAETAKAKADAAAAAATAKAKAKAAAALAKAAAPKPPTVAESMAAASAAIAPKPRKK